MVGPAERHSVFVAHLATERSRLRKPKMMWIGGLPAADKASLRPDELEVSFFPVTARFANRKHAFVNASTKTAAASIHLSIIAIQFKSWCEGTRRDCGRCDMHRRALDGPCLA